MVLARMFLYKSCGIAVEMGLHGWLSLLLKLAGIKGGFWVPGL
jgi:hypothetical protein